MTDRAQTSLAVVLHVIGLLEKLGVRYHLGGSFASGIHGVPRQTLDADLVVDLDPATVIALVDRLQRNFYVDLDVATGAVERRTSFNAVHLATGFKVDFFVKGLGEFDEVELERSQLVEVTPDPPRSAYVKSAEDTILRKLQWFRSGSEASDRQWRDVIGVLLAVGGSIDRDYLMQWAVHLGVEDLLARALAEAESG